MNPARRSGGARPDALRDDGRRGGDARGGSKGRRRERATPSRVCPRERERREGVAAARCAARGLGRVRDRARPGGLRLTVGSAQGRAMGNGGWIATRTRGGYREQVLARSRFLLPRRRRRDGGDSKRASAGVARFVVSGSEPASMWYGEMGGERRVGRIDRSREIGRGNGDCARRARRRRRRDEIGVGPLPRRGRGNGGAEARRVSPVPELLRGFRGARRRVVPPRHQVVARASLQSRRRVRGERRGERGGGRERKQSADDDALAEDVARDSRSKCSSGENRAATRGCECV